MRIWNAGIMDGGRWRADTWATPQGGPLSPLANVLPDVVDKALEARVTALRATPMTVNVYGQPEGWRAGDGVPTDVVMGLKLQINEAKVW